ncbi:hypothetical protein AgCh_021611 [Apium graveolens]
MPAFEFAQTKVCEACQKVKMKRSSHKTPICPGTSWIDPIKTHIQTGWFPNDATEARKLVVRALRYSLIDGILYKRSYVVPYLRCLKPDEARLALEEVHEGQRLALDLIDEVRDEAHAKIVEYRKKASFYYNLRVKERFFKQGDLVLRKVEASGVGQKGKLAPNWEGPYKVKNVQGRGTYKLETMDGFEVPRTWHAQNLKIYYV